MSGDLDRAGFGEDVTARTKWIAVAAFAAVTAVGTVPLTPSAPVAAAAGVVAVAAAALLVTGWRPQLLYAAAATAGLAVLTDGRSYNIGWFGVCLLAAWCVLTGGRREGVIYWAATMILFAVEWLWVRPDPGWGAWLAGVTLTVAFSLLIKHDRDLLRRLRQAQADLAEQAKTQERNRIARELHDVIGHTLTVSLLHVQSARLAVEHDPADAARALAEAERLGRECLAEVRSTVGLLRQDRPAGGIADDPASTASNAPLPGPDGLPASSRSLRSSARARPTARSPPAYSSPRARSRRISTTCSPSCGCVTGPPQWSSPTTTAWSAAPVRARCPGWGSAPRPGARLGLRAWGRRWPGAGTSRAPRTRTPAPATRR